MSGDFFSRQREFLEKREKKVMEQRKVKEMREEQEYQEILNARKQAVQSASGKQPQRPQEPMEEKAALLVGINREEELVYRMQQDIERRRKQAYIKLTQDKHVAKPKTPTATKKKENIKLTFSDPTLIEPSIQADITVDPCTT